MKYLHVPSKDLSHLHPKLTCGLYDMRASFQKCQMKDLDIYFSRAHVKDNECFGFEDDNIKNTFSVMSPLQGGSCGIQSYQNRTHVTYINVLHIIVESSGIITRNNTLAISLLCVYELDMMTSLKLALRPFIRSVNITVGGTGQFTATIALYKDSSYRTPYEGSEVILSSENILYIGVFIQGGETSKFVLVMRNCYATPTEYANDTLKYYIIKDSCPNKQDETIKVLENSVSRQGRVSVQMFKFVGDYDLVYLHCALSLCDITSGACAPSCSGARSRSAGLSLDSYDLKIGPIIRSGAVNGPSKCCIIIISLHNGESPVDYFILVQYNMILE
ncbi:uromodulin-like [Mantella aurantiaca]